jgi:hypothetical protein
MEEENDDAIRGPGIDAIMLINADARLAEYMIQSWSDIEISTCVVTNDESSWLQENARGSCNSNEEIDVCIRCTVHNRAIPGSASWDVVLIFGSRDFSLETCGFITGLLTH